MKWMRNLQGQTYLTDGLWARFQIPLIGLLQGQLVFSLVISVAKHKNMLSLKSFNPVCYSRGNVLDSNQQPSRIKRVHFLLPVLLYS